MDIVLVLDKSSSMAPLAPAIMRFALGVVGQLRFGLPADVQAGLVVFSENPSVVADLTPNRTALTAAIAAVSSFSSVGWTSISSGLLAALELLRRSPRRTARQALLLLTDGVQNERLGAVPRAT